MQAGVVGAVGDLAAGQIEEEQTQHEVEAGKPIRVKMVSPALTTLL